MLILGTTALFADREHVVFWAAMAYLGFLQVTAVVLNLLPVPGLDGYGALEPHLSRTRSARSATPRRSASSSCSHC
ncbi:peptidase M50 family protein [Mycobacteroides abscessus MAB_030201_1075]|uniref:Peptidase M50 family protein n=1 Tax=Mycobacteroides abscessus MAB_030201_1075 TaxID=1335410 RepID=A0A829PWF2_9MYCO|nr:peptidase M50 family protein [Mycobacteroides abscessus MAB_030201_1075]